METFVFDPSSLFVYGPLGMAVAYLLWERGKMTDKMDKMEAAHKAEVAALLALNQQLHDKRLEDHRVLIPLSNSMTTAIEQSTEVVTKFAAQAQKKQGSVT